MLQSLPPVPCGQYRSEVLTIFSTITAENKHKSIDVTNTHMMCYISARQFIRAEHYISLWMRLCLRKSHQRSLAEGLRGENLEGQMRRAPDELAVAISF